MAEFIGNSKNIALEQQKLFNYLSDFNNFNEFIPKDKLPNWQSTGTSSTFDMGAIGSTKLTIVNKVEYSEIQIEGSSKMNFKMFIFIKKIDDSNSGLSMKIDADLNSFMAMVAERPVTNFLNILTDKVEEHFQK